MINPECLINVEVTFDTGFTGKQSVVRRLPLGRDWSVFTQDLQVEILELNSGAIGVHITSITQLP